MRILGLGTAVPAGSLPQREVASLIAGLKSLPPKEARTLAALYRRSGVDRRGSVLLEGEGLPFLEDRPTTGARMEAWDRVALPLAAAAARSALADAGLAAERITHLVTASCTGFSAPGVDLALFAELGLRPDVERTMVGFMGCHGAMNALRVARALAAADPEARVLVVAVEVPSLHFDAEWDPERAVAEAVFADGAGALVGATGDGPWRVAATASRILPDSADLMTWRIGDRGFEMGLDARVPDRIAEHVLPWLEEWLATRGLTPGDVATWAPHPGGPRILESLRTALGLPRESVAASREVLAEHGNMSSATILFVLSRLRAQGAPRPCVALAFGPGLTAEAALIDRAAPGAAPPPR